MFRGAKKRTFRFGKKNVSFPKVETFRFADYKYSATYFERTTVPFYMDINLKASKRIGKYLNLAFYVNRLLGIYPDYTLRGVLQRRTSESPYFGMEMNLTF